MEILALPFYLITLALAVFTVVPPLCERIIRSFFVPIDLQSGGGEEMLPAPENATVSPPVSSISVVPAPASLQVQLTEQSSDQDARLAVFAEAGNFWPTPQEYNEALQNPATNLGDLELQNGSPALNHLGIPKPMSGAFASVYQFTCWGHEWAIKCFLHPLRDEESRYSKISQHLLRHATDRLVAFRFLPRGVCVKNHWFPIVKMEWVDGIPLSAYVENVIDKPELLRELADDFADAVISLRENGIAHGDLQHGNILVNEGRCRMVDYDGMFVPGLKGLRSHEIGHRNFQHPGRTGEHFGDYIDNFSAWVIYQSLLFLAEDGQLWHDFHGGDECLLFRADDFTSGKESPLFEHLLQNGPVSTRDSAAQLLLFCELPFDAVPPLRKG